MNREFSQALITYRTEHKLTQRDLAQMVEVNPRTIVLWESGESVPRKTMQLRLCQLLEIDPSVFNDGMDTPRKKAEQNGEASVDQLINNLGLNISKAGFSEQKQLDCQNMVRKILLSSED